MDLVPDTSATLLRDAADTQHARWSVLYARYKPMLQAYLRRHFPSLEADDIIQETFTALAAILPDYQYNPQKRGAFHNYLTGILRNKALRALDARKRLQTQKERLQERDSAGETDAADRDRMSREWKESLLQLALQQVLADESVQDRTKQVFLRTAVNGESIEAVAEAFGITRHAADCMRSRMVARLREIVGKLNETW